MTTFARGDAVHVKSVGKGIVREVRNGGRVLVDVGARAIVTTMDQLTAHEAPRKKPPVAQSRPHEYEPRSERSLSLDLHGMTVDEATEAVNSFLNDALLSGVADVRIIHGRSGGKLKASLHAQLKRIPIVRSHRVDPSNPGVTIVEV